MVTTHTVTYEGAGSKRQVTREVFTSYDGRVLGTETERVSRYLGSNEGWTWRERTTDTRQFRVPAEATAWLDEMFRDHEVAGVKQNGGTKMVFIV